MSTLAATEQLIDNLSQDDLSLLLRRLSNTDNLTESLEKFLEKPKAVPVKKVKKVEVVKPKTKSYILRKEVAVLLAAFFYPSLFNVDMASTSFNGSSSTPPENTITPPTTYKERDEHPVAIVRNSSEINNPIPVFLPNYDIEKHIEQLAKEAEEEEKQPVVTFDTRTPEELMAEAKQIILDRGPYEKAFADLRAIIATQPPEKAKEAHELLGYAYEKARIFDKAMGQYARWLALYRDDSEDTTRVRQRLMSLEIMNPRDSMQDVSRNKTREPRQGDKQEFSATLSEYLFANSSEPSGKLVQWHTDQVNSITGVQATWTLEHNQYTLSSRIRLTEVKDLTTDRGNRTNLSAAYVDFADTYRGWNVRLGRQSPEAGAISKFDGISSKIAVTDDLKITVAAGSPYVGLGNHTNRKFVGAQYEYDINKQWTVSNYINRETADGFLERMAVGSEYYYRDNGASCILRTEYDTLYHTLNLVTLQAMKYIGDYDLFAVLERRRSPMPYGDVALGIGGLSPDRQVYNTVGDLLTKSGLTTAEIYSYIEGTTPIATSAVLGISKRINKDWTVTLDLQRTNLSTTPGFNLNPNFDPIPIQVGQSNINSVTLHFKGDNVGVKGNSVEVVANDSVGPVKSHFVTIADNYRFNENKDSISAILRADSFDQPFGNTRSISGILRGIHNVGDHLILEAQYSRALNINPSSELKAGSPPYNTGQNFYLGFRYDY